MTSRIGGETDKLPRRIRSVRMTRRIARKWFFLFLAGMLLRVAFLQRQGAAAAEMQEYYSYMPAYFNFTDPLDPLKLRPTAEDAFRLTREWNSPLDAWVTKMHEHCPLRDE